MRYPEDVFLRNKANGIVKFYTMQRYKIESVVERYLSGRYKSEETNFVGFIKKIHISRYLNPILMFFMSTNLQYSIVLEYIFGFYKNRYFYSFNGV